MRNEVSLAGNGLSGSTHPGADPCAMCSGGMVMCVLCCMRRVALIHGPHDEDEHDAEAHRKTFLISHV
jgi:hypothetical protein